MNGRETNDSGAETCWPPPPGASAAHFGREPYRVLYFGAPGRVLVLLLEIHRIWVGRDWRVLYSLDTGRGDLIIEAVRRKDEGTYRR